MSDEWVTISDEDEGDWQDEPAPAKAGNAPGMIAGALGTAAAAAPALVSGGRRLIEEVATNKNVPGIGKKIMDKIGGATPLRKLSYGKQIYDVVTGKDSPMKAIADTARNEIGQQVITRAPGLVQKAALRIAPRLASLSGAAVSGVATGAAVPMALLAAMKHDQQRDTSHVGEGDSLADQIARAISRRGGR